MSGVDVVAIRAALTAATSGPWEWRGVDNDPEFPSVDGLCAPHADVLYGGISISNLADAELIVLLRNNVEALLAELERAQAASKGVEMLIAQARWRGAEIATQALWDVRRELGFDNDGDEKPDAQIAGGGLEKFCADVVNDAVTARWDAGHAERDAERRGAVKALREAAFAEPIEAAKWLLNERADAIERGADL